MDKIAIFLPIVSAVMWGLSYAMYERALQNLSVSTWLAITSITGLVTAYALSWFGLPKVDFRFLVQSDLKLMIAATLVFSTIGFIATLFAIKYVNATYASIGEVSYVLFVPVFSYLIFGYKNFNHYTLVGGLLVIAGVMIVIKGQYLSKASL